MKFGTSTFIAALVFMAMPAHAQFSFNGVKIFYTAGNVGIGINNPAFTLDVRSVGTRGIFGHCTNSSGTADGIYGKSSSTAGRGIVGYNDAVTGSTNGVFGRSDSATGRGVFGFAAASSGINFGVFGQTSSAAGFAGFFQGRGHFSGNLGVGTTTPSQNLHVAGNAKVTGWIGTDEDAAVEIFTNNKRVVRIIDATNKEGTSPNFVSGFSENIIEAGVIGATIAGGGSTTPPDELQGSDEDGPNQITANFGTIGGGRANDVLGDDSTVAGGRNNLANGSGLFIGGGTSNIASGSNSVVAGGFDNNAGGVRCTVGGGRANNAQSDYATVSGGQFNTANALASTVCGGSNNIASGIVSTVAGGSGSEATGDFSFAAGAQAKANHVGSFVWGDPSGGAVASSANNQMTFRATGGVRFFSNNGLTSGVTLAAGDSAWASVSDRNAKENFENVDTRELLDRLCAIPMTTWNYKSQSSDIRHIGPMAQDFSAAFGVGEDKLRITTIDADGVALAAIQGLRQIVKEKETELAEHKSMMAQQQRTLDQLVERLAEVEQALHLMSVQKESSK